MLKFRVRGELNAELKCSKQEFVELRQLQEQDLEAMHKLVEMMLEDSFKESLERGNFTVRLAVSQDEEQEDSDPEAEREVQKLIQQGKRTIGFKPNDPNLN